MPETQTEPVKMLSAFDRSTKGVDSRVINYPKLEATADDALGKENDLWREFEEADPGSIDELDRARALAIGYLVLTGRQLQTAPEREKSIVSKRFTEASAELYGEPEVAEVRRLIAKRYHELKVLLDAPEVEPYKLDRVLSYLEKQYGGVPEKIEEDVPGQAEALEKIKGAFVDQFGEALAIFDEVDRSQKEVPVDEIKRLFERAIRILAQEDEVWADMGVKLKKDKKSMSYDDEDNAISIGADGSYGPDRLQRLFIEEGIIHGLRSINGARTGNYKLQHGMPNYVFAEEGLAKFIQVAMGGELGERTEGYYMDSAFAMGLLGQKPITRPQLANLQIDMQTVLKQGKGEKIDYQKLINDSWRYVNRIYRGSLGNEHIGVNTKDIAYYGGYIRISEYIRNALIKGVDPRKLLDYLLAGKFDPTDHGHVVYIRDFLPTQLAKFTYT